MTRAEAERFVDRHLRFAPESAALIVDASCRLIMSAGGALSRRGYDPQLAVGRLLGELLPAGSWQRLQPHFERILAGHPVDFDYDSYVLGRTFRVKGDPLVNPDGAVEGALLVASERLADSSESLSKRLRQQSAVAEVGRMAITEEVDFARLVEKAIWMVVDNLDSMVSASVVELLPGQEHFHVHAETTGGYAGQTLPVAGSLVEPLLETLQPVVLMDAAAGPYPPPPALAALGMRSAACVPIGRPEAPFGVLSAFSSAVNELDEHDVHFLQSIANVLAEASRRERTDLELRRQALHDAITGLPNRILLDDRLRQSLTFAKRAGLQVAVLFIDLDRFKVINDSLGHHAGDEVLLAVADRLRSAVRSSDTVARFGGDEFVIVAPSVEGRLDAGRIAETVLAGLQAPISVAGQLVHVRASIGICVVAPTGDEDPAGLIRHADAALYDAKALGRGRYAFASTDTEPVAANHVVVERDLRQALAGDELRIVFQPVVRLADGVTVGAEALLRWQHPGDKYLMPRDFLCVAEQSGLIVGIGEWILRDACRHAATWSEEREFLLTVNLSASQLADPGVVAAVSTALSLSGLPSGNLGLELTEQVLFGDVPAVHRTLSDLKKLGVKLLLDDFGTGFSSLSHLKSFPIDVVKIDRSFIEGLDPDEGDDAAIVSAIVGMSHATGKHVIPEGIETGGQAQELQRLGCETGQGFLFSRPLDADAFSDRIARETRQALESAEPAGRLTSPPAASDRARTA